MKKTRAPDVYSIAAHRGFADALVAGIVPRYNEADFGLSRLTLLVPSSRAARTLSESFIRHAGENGSPGLLMPRMVMIGDLELDEQIASLLDPIEAAAQIPAAVDPTHRLFVLVEILREELGDEAPAEPALFRTAREIAATMDRLLAEQISPSDLLGERVLEALERQADHWRSSIHIFARVQQKWQARLEQMGRVDRATRRNLLFEHAAQAWRETPPQTPVIAAGITGVAPALARLLRVIADLPDGAVVLPELDLLMDDAAWEELGRAGNSDEADGEVFAKHDVATHPQYHLKLLLNRMGINRHEIRPWHRKGLSAGPPRRSHAISSLFLPPVASKIWSKLSHEKRSLTGVRTLRVPTSEEEALSIALMVREALEEPQKRVAIITPDRSLARRVAQNLARWNIAADDTAGRPLSLTAAGRFMLQLARLASDGFGPVELVAALSHPLIARGEARSEWLANLRQFDKAMRGPRVQTHAASLAHIANKAGVADWWDLVAEQLARLRVEAEKIGIAAALERLIEVGENLAGEGLWDQEDGRALSQFVDDLRLGAEGLDVQIAPESLHDVLRDAMEQVAVRPPYGGHPRLAIYGLLESRMTRADLVICAGLNEGIWPASPRSEPVLAPAILRVLGVPSSEFRIGLAAHDLASAMGAGEVVLTRAMRDKDGPTIPSRFLLRAEALLGERAKDHREADVPAMARLLDRDVSKEEAYEIPQPSPPAELRDVAIKVTALDRLLGDPYQFYAAEILRLRRLEPLDADPDAAWRGTLAHRILQRWHDTRASDPTASILAVADTLLEESELHPLMRALWQPRLVAALEWVERKIDAQADRSVLAVERKGEMTFDGVRIYGRADRIDQLADGSLAIIDYKTGKPPATKQVVAGYALQLGLLGLIAEDGGFEGVSGEVTRFEYWSLAKKGDAFGYVASPVKAGQNQSKLMPEEFIPKTRGFLEKAVRDYIKGREPFTARLNPDYEGFDEYDQLMRLAEWQTRESDEAEERR